MESHLVVVEAETTGAQWVKSAGGDLQVMDEVEPPVRKQEALGAGRVVVDEREMRRNELLDAPSVLEPSCTEHRGNNFVNVCCAVW
jgi:hypothetical protein